MRTVLGLLWAAVLLALSRVSVCLQAPSALRVEAINTRYTLHWDWSEDTHTHLHACYTVQYLYSHQVDWGSKSVCEGVCVRVCDLSHHLRFSGSYLLRVGAGLKGQRSSWSHNITFTPEEDMLLGPPRSVSLSAGVAMVTVRVSEPVGHLGRPMRQRMKDLKYRIQYWETHTPTRVHHNETDIALLTLRLQPNSEYCVRVCVFSNIYNKISNYTHTQCTHTQGPAPVWQVSVCVCAGVCVCFLLAASCHLWRKQRKTSPPPHILQGPPLSHLSLLHLCEERCSMVTVETAALATRTRREHQVEMEGLLERRECMCEDSGMERRECMCEGERRESVCDDSGVERRESVCEDSGLERRVCVCEGESQERSVCVRSGEKRVCVRDDSGVCSADESSDSSCSLQNTHTHTHTHTRTHTHTEVH